jgi:hypothetical protein
MSPLSKWSVFILPYIEQGNVANICNFKADWNSPANSTAIQSQMKVFHCPSTPAGERSDTTIAAAPACGDYDAVNAIKNFVGINSLGLM